MSTSFLFSKYDKPVESGPDAFSSGLATFLLGAGIVNPMGPTLNVLAMEGLGNPGDTAKVCQLSLNPFNQSCNEVGEVVIGDVWNPPHDLMPFLDGWGSCPTLLIPSALYNQKAAEELFSRFLQRFEDGAETLQQIRKHPGDPWTRVKGEMDGLAGMLQRLMKGNGEEKKDGPLDATAAAEYAKLQLDPKNLKEEFSAFMFAWEGSQNFLKMPGTSKEDFLQVFSRLAMTARVPFMRNIIDNPEILEGDLGSK